MESYSTVTTLDRSSGDEFEDKTSSIKKARVTKASNQPNKKIKIPRAVNLYKLPDTIHTELQQSHRSARFKEEVVDGCSIPIDYFKKLLIPEYIEQVRSTTQERLYEVAGSETITANDVNRLIGMLFVMDLYPLHQVEHYFGKRNSLFKSDVVDSAWTVESFRELHNHITMPGGDAMYLFKMIEDTVKRSVIPSGLFSLDEMLRKFMGQYRFKHRIPDKPAKEGIKYFLLCCSVLKVPFVFTFHDNQLESNEELSKTANMVHLMITKLSEESNVPFNEIILFTDNYFNSYVLFKTFATMGVRCVGTFKSNLIPKEVKEEYKQCKTKLKQRYVQDDVVYCPVTTYECEGIYYLFVVDNGEFCITSNDKELVDKGTKS